MSGISKIIDERIEQLRREKIELDAIRRNLTEREEALKKREKAQASVSAKPAAPITPAIPPAPPKRGRGRPRKGEAPPPSLPTQAELTRMRTALFAELTELEEKKTAVLEEMQRELAALDEEKITRRMEMDNQLARLKLQNMTALEKELEEYREECFANLQAEYVRQRELVQLRAREGAPPPEKAAQTPAAPKRRGRPAKSAK